MPAEKNIEYVVGVNLKLRSSVPSVGQASFITFSCYKNRRLLSRHHCKELVRNELAAALAKHDAGCLGFVVMPDHVHALIHLDHSEQLPDFMKRWKRVSSYRIKKHLLEHAPDYFPAEFRNDPVWKHRYYCFPVVNQKTAREKIEYMHHNPVKAGLFARAEDWEFSSAGHYLSGKQVGVAVTWLW